MREKNKKKYYAGFSMVELVVVVGIIGLLSAIAVPMLMERLPEYRLRSVTRDIVSCLQEAKMRAVNENADTVINFDTVNDLCKAWVDNGTGAGTGNRLFDPHLGEEVFNQVSLSSDLAIYQTTDLSDNNIVYNSRGFPASNVGSIFVRNNKSNYRRIILNVAGNIRVVRSSDGTNWE